MCTKLRVTVSIVGTDDAGDITGGRDYWWTALLVDRHDCAQDPSHCYWPSLYRIACVFLCTKNAGYSPTQIEKKA